MDSDVLDGFPGPQTEAKADIIHIQHRPNGTIVAFDPWTGMYAHADSRAVAIANLAERLAGTTDPDSQPDPTNPHRPVSTDDSDDF